MAVSSFTSTGAKATTAIKLPKEIFGLEVTNHELLKQAYVAHQANGRINLAKTLKRGEVSGGGKKPWRQKGTGNARTGSIRNPIWRGGGITFGPEGNENYSKKVNASSRKTSLRQSLSLAVSANKVVTIDDFAIKSGKTADAAKLLAKLNKDNRTTVVVGKASKETIRSVANLKEVRLVNATSLSVVDVLDSKFLVLTKDAVAVLEKRLGGTK